MLRTKQSGSLAICHRCLAKSERIMGGSGAPCDSKDTAEFPKTPCEGGIRATVIFPSCWDGKNLDSPDHRSHVTYQTGSALAGDKCPASHPVRIPQVMYEIMYDTSGFANPNYYKNGKQPLVYSFGDPLAPLVHFSILLALTSTQYGIRRTWRLSLWLGRWRPSTRNGRSWNKLFQRDLPCFKITIW